MPKIHIDLKKLRKILKEECVYQGLELRASEYEITCYRKSSDDEYRELVMKLKFEPGVDLLHLTFKPYDRASTQLVSLIREKFK